MALANAPDRLTVACYWMTRGAQRAWQAINHQLEDPHGALFWIGGPAAAGKTHFLNYVIALGLRAGPLSAETARHLTIAAEISAPAGTADLERRLLEQLSLELAGDNGRAATLWRQLRGAEALRVALDHARHQGVKSVSLALDFGTAESESATEWLRSLAELAARIRTPRLTVIAAGRGQPPPGAQSFDVTPAPDEEIAVAIGRTRRLDDSSPRRADESYRGIDLGDLDGRAIFPFHPAAADALHVIGGRAAGIAGLARIAREAVLHWCEARDPRRLIYPAEVMSVPSGRATIEARLGETGRTALKLALAAADALAERNREVARDFVGTLVLQSLVGSAPSLDLEQLRAQMPSAAEYGRPTGGVLAEIAGELAARSRGVIVFDPAARTAQFNPRAAGAPQVAAFNSALTLARRFDPTLTPANEMPELRTRHKRLGDAMAEALETAARNRESFGTAVGEAGGMMSAAQQRAFADFIAIAEGGAQALIETGADTERCAGALEVVAAYEALAAIAAAAPRLRAMRDYLDATNLRAEFEDDQARDRRLVELETQCQLLRAAVNPSALSNASRVFEALEARFQTFKWTYVQHYRAAHQAWRGEMERVAGLAIDARGYVAALRRLNAIVALGPPEGAELSAQMTALQRRVVRCDFEGPLSPEITPLCPRCGFVLGTPSPRPEIDDAMVLAKRALQAKLAVLSQSAIARLICEHDDSHRLEGFLKITQAAQAEALVRVLDDKLARYLARLLDDNVSVASDGERRGVVRNIRAPRLKRHGVERGGRQLKSSDDDS
jgi:hypothetical protein